MPTQPSPSPGPVSQHRLVCRPIAVKTASGPTSRRTFTFDRCQRDPAGFWADRLTLQRELFGANPEPNVAHEVLARLCRDGPLTALLTQNTDGLHGDAGDELHDQSDDSLIELHGNARRVQCLGCGDRQPSEPVFERVADGERPPRCPCGGVYKPDVVLFGESLPTEAIARARTLARESDVFLAIGSSLVVEPAASLPRLAGAHGAQRAVISRADATR